VSGVFDNANGSVQWLAVRKIKPVPLLVAISKTAETFALNVDGNEERTTPVELLNAFMGTRSIHGFNYKHYL